MTNPEEHDLPLNPAHELHDLIQPWATVTNGSTSLQLRGGDEAYWPLHSRANHLLDEVEAYIIEKATLSGRNKGVPGQKELISLRHGINAPNIGLNFDHSTTWQAIDPGALDWLEGVGIQWDRRKLAPHQAEIREIVELSRHIETILSDLTEEKVDSIHRDYMLELCDALRKAARDADIYGEPATARLAFELSGVLESFLPQDEQPRNLLARLKRAASRLLVAISKEATLELLTGPSIKAITTGLTE